MNMGKNKIHLGKSHKVCWQYIFKDICGELIIVLQIIAHIYLSILRSLLYSCSLGR